MAKLTIVIDFDNEAFQDSYWASREVERIAGAIAVRIDDGELEGTGRDINGNTCARWEIR